MKSSQVVFAIVLSVLVTQANGEAGGKKMSSVQESIQLKKDEKSVAPIFSGPFKVIGIGLMKGQKLEKHQTPTPAFLYVHSGAVEFSLGQKKETLRSGDYIAIPAKEMHEVEAIDDSRLMLIK